jgi:hypothetical protein
MADDRDMTQFVHECLSEAFGDLAAKGWEPPFSLTIVDRAGLSATAEIDEDWEPYDWVIDHQPVAPFSVTIDDEDRGKGARVDFEWLNS